MNPVLRNLSALRGYRPRILVADDQPLNIRLVHLLFKDDCDVFMATNGLQVLAQCQSTLPDLILLDVVMPEMDGHEAIVQLKHNPDTADIPVIFLTSRNAEADEVKGFELGAVDFISKPINETILRARVNTHLLLKLQADFLRSVAMVDGLTGLANRRKFEEDLRRDWLQCARNRQDLSLLMIDVDHFKRYNDHYGHQQGDACLRDVAQTIKHCLKRPGDLSARYGGEEFVCMLPNTSSHGAMTVAQHISDAVRALHIPHACSDAAQTVTLSIGVACTQPHHTSAPASLLQLADKQLYLAKGQGRNRVASATAPCAGTA